MSAPATGKGHVAQLFGRDSLYMLIWAVQIISAAVLTPVTTRLLGLTEFGTVTAANAVMQVLFVVVGLGLQTAVQREYAATDDPRGARRLVAAATVLTVALTALAWATVDLWAGALRMADETTSLRLSVIWAGTGAMTAISLALLRSQDKLGWFSLISFLQSVVAEALSLGAVKYFEPTAEVFLAGQVAAQIEAAALGLLLAPPLLLRWADREVLFRALWFALPLVPSALSSFLLSTSDRLIVEAHLGSDAVARYQVAYNVASMPMLLLSVLNSAWMPRFFGITADAERRTVLAESRDTLYRLMVPILAGFAFGAPIVLRVWAPASYHPEQLHFVVGIVLITAIPFAGQLAVTRSLMAEGRTGVTAVATLAAAAVNVVGNLLLVPRYALTGSAVATLVSYVFLHLVLALADRRTQVPSSPWSLRLQLGAVTVLALLSSGVPDTALTLTLRGIAGAAAGVWFLLLLVRIGRTSQQDPPIVGPPGVPPEPVPVATWSGRGTVYRSENALRGVKAADDTVLGLSAGHATVR